MPPRVCTASGNRTLDPAAATPQRVRTEHGGGSALKVRSFRLQANSVQHLKR